MLTVSCMNPAACIFLLQCMCLTYCGVGKISVDILATKQSIWNNLGKLSYFLMVIRAYSFKVTFKW